MGGARNGRLAAVAAVKGSFAIVLVFHAILLASEIGHVKGLPSRQNTAVGKYGNRRHIGGKILIKLRSLAFPHAVEELPHDNKVSAAVAGLFESENWYNS